MKLPDFIVIGAMKSGTTSFRWNLDQHPEIFLPSKESRFFYNETNFKKGVNWYKEWFVDADKNQIIGESSGLYSHCEKFPLTAKRMYEILPNCKIIYLVRNPVERIKSHWSWEIANGRSLGTINNAIREKDFLIEQSNYWKQISIYRKYFKDKNIKILFFEDLVADRKAFLYNIWNFLEVDENYETTNQQVHRNKTDGRLTDTNFLIYTRRLLPSSLGNFLPVFLKKALKTNKKPSTKLSVASLEYISNQLNEDTVKFLEYSGKPKNFWTFTN